jgi:hypothetical protein
MKRLCRNVIARSSSDEAISVITVYAEIAARPSVARNDEAALRHGLERVRRVKKGEA